MGKKCIPGMFCVENMTLALIILILFLMIYLFYRIQHLGNNKNKNTDSVPFHSLYSPVPVQTSLVTTRNQDIFNDPYIPPLRTPDGFIFTPNLTPTPTRIIYETPTVPISVMTQPFDPQYRQVGILTRDKNGGNAEILPLMGRRNQNSRDKWQYYTVTGGGNGNIQTKLPVSVKGKSCTGEYGCDQIYNNDTVYVEGYKDIFVATIYESSGFSYIP